MLPSERREFVRTHRTCVFGTARRADGPAMSIVYYVPTATDELLVSTMRDRGKAKAVACNPKVSLCVLDDARPFVAAMAEQEDRVVLRCRPYDTFAQPPRHLHSNDQDETIIHWVSARMPWGTPDPS
jgi:hypothetical protein